MKRRQEATFTDKGIRERIYRRESTAHIRRQTFIDSVDIDRTLVGCGRSKGGLGSEVGVASAHGLSIVGRHVRRRRRGGRSCQLSISI